MTQAGLLEAVVSMSVMGALLAVIGYIVVRVVSFAYYRTKLEYMHKLIRGLKLRGEEDGR